MQKPQFITIVAGLVVMATAQPAWAEAIIYETEVPRLNETPQSATTVGDWVTQMAQASGVAQIRNIQLQETPEGIEVVLEAANPITIPTTSTVANALIVTIPNAVLVLPNGNEFQTASPAEGIAFLSATNLPDNQVRLVVTGTTAPPAAQAVANPQNLTLSITSNSETEAAQEQESIQIVVTGEQETDRYYIPNASTATRTDTPIQEIPTAIQVIPQAVLEDQAVVEVRDALQNVGGVTSDGNYGGTGSGSFVIRGFSQETLFRNGFRVSDFYSVPEIANIEQIEVLRGPASVLFGQVQPGGIVNIVTEQPLPFPAYAIDLAAGQFSFYRSEIDISGPLTNDENLLYRLNLAYQNSGSFRDEVSDERVFVAPVLQWNISDTTSLTVEFEYLYNDPVFDRGVTALSDGSLVLPIDRFLGYPQLDEFTTEIFRFGYRFEHEFSEDWRIENALLISSAEQGGARADLNGGLIDDRFIPRQLRDDESARENYGLQTNIIGNFATGSIQHELLFGVDLSRTTFAYDSEAADLPPLNIFDPNYDIDAPDELQPRYGEVSRSDLLGVYLQDQIDLTDNLILLLGGRVDFTEQDQVVTLEGTSSSQSETAFSPRVGIVYQPIEPISLYASYSRSFFPVIGLSRDGSAFDPERGTQYEIGIKAELNERLSATLAAYHLTKTNVLTIDPDDPNFSIQVGEQRSQGIELYVSGEILPGWDIIASYAHTDAEVTEDNELPEGSPFPNVAENTFSLWTKYEIQNGNFQGLGFGLGFFFVDDRPGFANFDPPGFELPSYFRTDAAIYYERDNWRAQLNVNNLFDVEYYETAQGADIVYPGAPFNVVASFSYRF
jgi:iron complex outermembrane receptor protein